MDVAFYGLTLPGWRLVGLHGHAVACVARCVTVPSERGGTR